MFYSVEAVTVNSIRAVGDDDSVVQIDIKLMPKAVKIGDIVYQDGNAYLVSESETKTRQQRIKNKLNDLLGRSATDS